MSDTEEVEEIGIRGIPKESKLLILGDWFQNPGQDWKVVCYFYNQENGYFRKALAIDLLPALTPGAVFPRTSTENKAQGWTETFKLPKIDCWERASFKDLPRSLKRASGFSDQFEDGVLYRIETDQKTYWLPASELARILFFHSSEVVRAAVYQGNTWQLGRAWSDGWVGQVQLSSNVPVRYMNSLQYRKFFTWLLFNPSIESCFGSIHRIINQKSKLVNGAERWTFDFSPPDLSHCEISLAGFTGRDAEEGQVFIREIRSVSGLRSPDLDVVYFSHPDDDISLEQESEADDANDKPPKPGKPKVDIKKIDPDNKPKASKKRHLVKLGINGLRFDVEPDTRRSPRQVTVLPPQVKPELDELEEQDPEELASLLQGSDSGNGPRADLDNFKPPELIDAPEKIVFFQTMLQKLEEEYGWSIENHMGDVPKKRCRSQHLVDGRPRRYCHAIIQRDESTTVQILEIELTSKLNGKGDQETESLSTLFFKAGDTTTTFLSILDELMTSYKDGPKSLCWKKEFISANTTIREYVGHPDNKVKSEEDALESWVARSAEKVKGM